MKRNMRLVYLILFFLLFGQSYYLDASSTQNRFPKPEFETGYQQPISSTPPARSAFYEYLDVSLLILFLSLASYLALKKRSRKGLWCLALASLIYFGFIREGCTCAIGSIQNIAYALADSTYILPISVIAFFAIPLLFTLFMGRTFCAAVCPLGALQDMAVLKPTKIPNWLSHVLSVLPYIYLGFAVLFAATGSAFIICQYDPFVAFFRLSGSFNMIVYSFAFLILSVFIARPYCRFLCPYGVLLNWMSKLSRRHVTISPDTCIQCRLCEDSCPFDAIQKPTPEKIPEDRKQGVKRLAVLLIVLPVVVVVMGWTIANLNTFLSKVHPKVQLSEQIILEDTGKVTETTLETRTFRSSGKLPSELYDEALNIRKQYYKGGWILGGFIGLIFMLKLIGLSIYRTRKNYEPDRGACFSCGRCFSYCPKEYVLKKVKLKN